MLSMTRRSPEHGAKPAAMVFLRTDSGGTRVLDMLVGDPLPRSG